MRPTRILSSFVFLAALASGAEAFAASSGTIKGEIFFYQNQGNYCPASRAPCTGARYREAEYHTNRPMGDMKVLIRRKSDDKVIGQGTTNSSGAYTISWSDPAASGDVAAQIVFRGEHKDGRFQLKNTGGGFWIFWSNVTLDRGTQTDAGRRTWGNSASPHALANLYDGAQKMWARSLAPSNRMSAHFTDVDIVAYDSAACPTSCASGPNNRITIDSSGSAYRPQARIMHEMGHIASYRGSRDQEYRQNGSAAYCFGGEASPCGWGLNSAENASVHFEEAAATFLGDVAMYTQGAVAPHTCNSSVACTNNSFNIETSGGTSCGTNDDRRPINAVRYFWDLYDSSSDFTGESISQGQWYLVDTIHAFDNGAGDTQKNEVWNSALTSMDDLDGRSCRDFRDNWIEWGTNSTTVLANNCGSQGD